MQYDLIDKERRKRIFAYIKPHFRDKLGKFTHQRISDEWHFHGLGFVRDEMTYVFGINVGFFKLEVVPHIVYSHTGMNILVRTNGINPDIRARYKDFFEKHLHNWVFGPEKTYTSFRGGIGVEFPRYKKLDEFENDDQIIDFLIDSIDKVSCIYEDILRNEDSIFSHVVRAAPPWHDTLLQLCIDVLAMQGK